MTTQQQDLVFFNDNSLLSDKILSDSHALLVITHAEGTQPAWLINSLVESCLVGTANLVNRDLVKTPNARALVTYVSFLHTQDFVFRSCRKQGMDLETADDFFFVDCFSELFTKQITKPGDSKAQVKDLFSHIAKQVQSRSQGSNTVIIHSPEVLLAATNLTSNDLIHHLQKVNQNCNALIVVSNTDEALIDISSTTPADPVFRITDFFVKLHHKSSLNVNILPLATGKAKDITGCVTVAKGAFPAHKTVKVVEKEYVFHVSKEGNVKVFFR